MKRNAGRGIVLILILLLSLTGGAVTYFRDSIIITSSDSRYPVYQSGFYGYNNSNNGPGDDAFDKCLALMRKVKRPLLLIWCKDASCTVCDGFTQMANGYDRTFPGGVYNLKSVNAYFRGGETSPKACADARKFFDTHMGGAKGTCHLFGLYGEFDDGVKFYRSGSLPSAGDAYQLEGSFFSMARNWINAYDAEAKNHETPAPPPPPPSNVKFIVGTSDGARLEAKPSTKNVFVPLQRVENTGAAETNWLVAVYADGTAATNEIPWDIDQTFAEVPVLSKWTDGATIGLALLNTNRESTVTSAITCVPDVEKSPCSPLCFGEKEKLEAGEWSIDGSLIDSSSNNVAILRQAVIDSAKAYDSATNALVEAVAASNTTYEVYIAASNELASAIEVYDIATNALAEASAASNTTYAVYSEKQTALDDAITAYETATNALADAVTASNTTYGAYVNASNVFAMACSAYEDAVAAFEATVATTNSTYGSYTNKQEAFELAIADYNDATNALAVALSEYGIDSQEYNDALNAVVEAATAKTTVEGELNTAYGTYTNAVADVVSKQAEAGAKEGELETAQAERDNAYGTYTNAVADVVSKQAESETKEGELGPAQAERDNAYGIYTNAVAVVESAQIEAEIKRGELATAQGDCETAKTNYDNAVADVEDKIGEAAGSLESLATAIAERDAAEGGYFLVLSGSVVANDEVGKIQALFDSDEYKEWALSNNVRNIVLDCPANATNSWTGASLLSYDTAANGKSGAGYVSANGLSSEAAASYSQMVKNEFYKRRRNLASAGSPEVLVFRADGSYVGQLVESRIENTKLKPALKYQEEYSIDENIARLGDLLKLNGEAGGEPSEVAYDETGYGDLHETTLQVNDPERQFYVTGLPTNTYFDLNCIVLSNLVPNADFKVEFQASDKNTTNKWVAVTPAKRNTWILNEGDLSTNVYRVAFSAYSAPRYEVYGPGTDFTVYFSFTPMMPDPGKIGFKEASKKITEGSATGVDITVERTEWHSGTVTGYLHIVEGEGGTTAKPYRFSWPTNDVGEYAPVALEWNDGELGAKSFSLTLNNDEVWDGDEKIVMMLTGDGEYGYVDFGEQKYTLTIVEDDSKSPGRIGFSADAPDATPQTKPGVVFAKENTDITLGVERIGGASGDASVRIASTAGTVRTESLTWTDKDTETVKYATVSLPALKAGQQQATFYVSLVRDGEVPIIATASRMQVRVLPNDAPEFALANVPVVGFETEQVYSIIPLASEIPAGATVTLSHSSGTVPVGVTVKFNREFNAIEVSGVPLKCGDFSATYQVVVRNGGKTMYSMPVTIGFTLGSRASANAFVATARVFNDLPVVDTNANRLVGLVDVTLPVNGRHAAKFRSAAGKTVSFTAEGWLSLAPDAATAYFSSKGTLRLAFSVSDAGAVTATLFDVDTDESFDIVRPAGETWSAAYPAAGYQGNYAVRLVPAGGGGAALCTGAAPLSLRMIGVGAVRTGKMTFAGTLPNGRSISGTAALMEAADATSAALPILSASAADTLTGIMRVVNGFGLTSTNYAAKAVRSEEVCATVWDHVEKKKPAEYSYYVEFDAFGSYIPSGLNWEEQWKRDFGTATLVFSIPGVSETTAISASGKTLKIADTRANPLGVAIRTFNATTGVLSGSARAGGKTVSWGGTLVPDWGGPMMQGACWRTESGVKTGDSVKLDVAE